MSTSSVKNGKGVNSGADCCTPQLDRRAFLKVGLTTSGGLLVALYVPAAKAALSAQAPPPAILPFAYLKIAPDNTVTVIANHSEMGQGIYTVLPMLLNEELQADWTKIRIDSAPVDAVYNHNRFPHANDRRQHHHRLRMGALPQTRGRRAADARLRCRPTVGRPSDQLQGRKGRGFSSAFFS